MISIIRKLSLFEIEREPFFQETVTPGFFIFGIIGTVLYGVLWSFIWPQPYESISARSVLVASLLFAWYVRYKASAPHWIKEVSLYGTWYCVQTFFFYMYFANGTSNLVWAASLICGTYMNFSALQFTTASILFLLGAATSTLAAMIVLGSNSIHLTSSFESLLAVLAFALASAYHATNRRIVLDRAKTSGAMAAIAVLAHEVRSPLFALRANLFNIQSRMEQTDPNCEEYSILQRLVRRVDDVNSTLNLHLENLRFSNTIAAKLPLQPVSTQDVIRDAIEVFGAVSNEIFLDVDIESVFVMGNKDGIRQVLVNLLRNGSGAIRSVGGGTLTIKCKRSQGIVRFSVTDTAATLSRLDADRIFAPFVSFRTNAGIGVGLFASRVLCEAMNASIGVYIVPGVSTMFEFVLPETERTAT